MLVAWGWLGAGSRAVPGVRAGDRTAEERPGSGSLRPSQWVAELDVAMGVRTLLARGNRGVAPECGGPVMGLSREWRAFAAVLATMPDLVDRLLAAHTPTTDGRWCTACTSPGQGTPHAHWPCAIALLAAEAARVGG